MSTEEYSYIKKEDAQNLNKDYDEFRQDCTEVLTKLKKKYPDIKGQEIYRNLCIPAEKLNSAKSITEIEKYTKEMEEFTSKYKININIDSLKELNISFLKYEIWLDIKEKCKKRNFNFRCIVLPGKQNKCDYRRCKEVEKLINRDPKDVKIENYLDSMQKKISELKENVKINYTPQNLMDLKTTITFHFKQIDKLLVKKEKLEGKI